MGVVSRDKPNTASAIRYVLQAWGINAFGWRATGSVPNSDHPKGLALDIPIPAGSALGNTIARWFLDHADAFGTAYVIWNRRIANPGGGWRSYSGPNPHTDHVHVSLRAGGGSSSPLSGVASAASSAASSAAENLVATVAEPLVKGARQTVLTVAFVGGGLLLVALGGWRGVQSARVAK